MELSLQQDKEILLKQRDILRLMEQGMTHAQAMIEVGFQDALSRSPKAVLASDAWALVMEKYLPDENLMEKHNALLDKKQIFYDAKNGEVVETEHIDAQAVAKGLDMAYKLKGKYIADKKNPDDPITPEVDAMALAALQMFIEQKRTIDITPAESGTSTHDE